MTYDALQESTPGRAAKEYLKILKLAAGEGETAVDEALRELLERNGEAAITVESIGEALQIYRWTSGDERVLRHP